jgi:hypothetical protein
MERRRASSGIGADIGGGGARESSRQSGRNAEKAVVCQSARGRRPNSASPPWRAPSPATTAAGCDCVTPLQSLPVDCIDCYTPPSRLPAAKRGRGAARGAQACLELSALFSLAAYTTQHVQPQPLLTRLPRAISAALYCTVIRLRPHRRNAYARTHLPAGLAAPHRRQTNSHVLQQARAAWSLSRA